MMETRIKSQPIVMPRVNLVSRSLDTPYLIKYQTIWTVKSHLLLHRDPRAYLLSIKMATLLKIKQMDKGSLNQLQMTLPDAPKKLSSLLSFASDKKVRIQIILRRVRHQ